MESPCLWLGGGGCVGGGGGGGVRGLNCPVRLRDSTSSFLYSKQCNF